MLTESQLEMRRTRLGGSDAPAVFGLDKYRGPKDVWREKLGLAPPFQGNAHTERGDFLEDGVARWAASRLGLDPDALESLGSLLHPTLPHVLATPDRVVRTDAGLVVMQVKCPSLNTCRRNWLVEPPAKVVAQISWEMGLLEALGETVASGVAVALAGDVLKAFPVPYEPELARDMHLRGNEWFKRFVLTGEEP